MYNEFHFEREFAKIIYAKIVLQVAPLFKWALNIFIPFNKFFYLKATYNSCKR